MSEAQEGAPRAVSLARAALGVAIGAALVTVAQSVIVGTIPLWGYSGGNFDAAAFGLLTGIVALIGVLIALVAGILAGVALARRTSARATAGAALGISVVHVATTVVVFVLQVVVGFLGRF